jgi:hypothetical protein
VFLIERYPPEAEVSARRGSTVNWYSHSINALGPLQMLVLMNFKTHIVFVDIKFITKWHLRMIIVSINQCSSPLCWCDNCQLYINWHFQEFYTKLILLYYNFTFIDTFIDLTIKVKLILLVKVTVEFDVLYLYVLQVFNPVMYTCI